MFCTFRSHGSCTIESRAIAGFFQSLESLGSLVFHLFPFSISYAYTSRDPMSMKFPRKDKCETYNYIIKRTSGSCNWLFFLIR